MGAPGTARAAFDPGVFARMMRPKSIAIIGMSAKPNTPSHIVLRNLLVNEFPGDIHLIGRNDASIEGVPIRTDITALPKDLDVAVLSVPAAGVEEALAACVERKVGVAVVFAAGFAEAGEQERGRQERIGKLASDGGLAVVGPNCIGYVNYLDGLSITFASVAKVPRVASGTREAVAIVAQSGGLGNHLKLGLNTRGIPVSYVISTGNEMVLGLGDFVRFLLADEATRVITIYAEHIRQPAAFLQAAEQARAAGKAIVMLHPGRGARAKEAAKSHTGALAGDHAVMRAITERAGVLLIDSLDELLDTSEILARYPKPSSGELGILTLSGAFCGIAHDFCEDLGIPIPSLSPATEAALRPRVPGFILPRNPLDLGTQPIWQPEITRIGLEALMQDPGIGGVAISMPMGSPEYAIANLKQIVAGVQVNGKPVTLSMFGDETPLAPEFIQIARDNKIIVSRSADRSLRAMGAVLRWGSRPVAAAREAVNSINNMPELRAGTVPEWVGKKVLAAAGIAVPRGGLVETLEQAAAIAKHIGYPVALKAQAEALAHKTEAGGVILGVADEAALGAAWTALTANVARTQPGLRLDGVLVEAMAERGLELVIGARRDPQWGPVVLVGLGGIFVEALQDVRIVGADAAEDEILAEFQKLKAARLLHGFRNLPPIDVAAAAKVAKSLGRLMMVRPDISDIEINPLMVHARGRGATALDALVVIS